MSNQLQTTNKAGAVSILENFAEVEKIGAYIARSAMFGCDTEAQGTILAMTCVAEGITPIQFNREYHIVKGRVTDRADAMLAKFNQRGGKHRLISRTSELAAVELTTRDGDVHEFTFSWDEAQGEAFPWTIKRDGNKRPVLGDDGEPVRVLKDTWATVRGRKQMMWARVISDAVRAIDPGVCAGTYTPEEVQDFDDESAPPAIPVKAVPVVESIPGDDATGPAVEVDAAPVVEATPAPPAAAAPTAPAPAPTITHMPTAGCGSATGLAIADLQDNIILAVLDPANQAKMSDVWTPELQAAIEAEKARRGGAE